MQFLNLLWKRNFDRKINYIRKQNALAWVYSHSCHQNKTVLEKLDCVASFLFT